MEGFLNLFFKGDACRPLVNLEGKHVSRYRSFKSLLQYNHSILSLMAGLEQLYYGGRPFGLTDLREKVRVLFNELKNLLDAFQSLSGGKYPALREIFQKLKDELERELNPRITYPSHELVLPLESVSPETRPLVGTKAGNLSAIKNDLKLPSPEGFAVSAFAYQKFIEENHLAEPIEAELSRFDPDSLKAMEQISTRLMTGILRSGIPENIRQALLAAYDSLEKRTEKGVRISMRSSAIGEDTEAGFAGQFQTVLNVRREGLFEAYKTVLASKYSTRALLYRYRHGFIDRLTPMAVAAIQMIDARTSGVLYSRDPQDPGSDHLKISSLWGLGERLVNGSASPDQFLVDRKEMKIRIKEISRKDQRLVNSLRGGTVLEEVPYQERERPSLSDEKVLQLARWGLKLEGYFGRPQDIEWVLDYHDRLFILQSRPLNLVSLKPDEGEFPRDFPGHTRLISKGRAASRGIAAGPVFLLREGEEMEKVTPGSILVAKTASPDYAGLMGRIKGIITDIGSVTSHLASVAREFGVPALFDTGKATSVLTPNGPVTLYADYGIVYQGIVEELSRKPPTTRNPIFESPLHRRLKTILDLITPLNLIDSHDPSFSPEGCRTFHDLTRFTHEMAVKEMFGLAGAAGRRAVSVKLTSTLPLFLYLIDLGGGLKGGLSTCEEVTPDQVESIPMKALWKGFTHPGITWTGSINFDLKKFMTLMAAGAASEFGEIPGGESYALLSGDYLNFNAKFGYHFTTVDTLCGPNSSQNYVALQFSGGAGNFTGRSLRVLFLANVLKKLGFEISVQGDLLEAYVTGYDRTAMEEKLDQLGRLLACSRLLDMVVSGRNDIERMTALFFQEEYDFLAAPGQEKLKGFYVQLGDWKETREEGRTVLLQDGSQAGFFWLSGLVGLAHRVVGASAQEFLDNLGAYYYFPLAIVKNSEMSDGTVQVQVNVVKGNIDRAGGIAFGIKNAGNYFVFRLNALEDNVILFEYVNNNRIQRAEAHKKIESDRWYRLEVELEGRQVKGYVDEELTLDYKASVPIKGHVGLWTKADSTTKFRDLDIDKDKPAEPAGD